MVIHESYFLSTGGIYALVFANISNIILNWTEDWAVRRQGTTESAPPLNSPLRSNLLLVMRLGLMCSILSIDVISTLVVEGHTNYRVHVPGNP